MRPILKMIIFSEDGKRIISLSEQVLYVNDKELVLKDNEISIIDIFDRISRPIDTGNNLIITEYGKSNNEILLLLALTQMKNRFFIDHEEYELSFAYAVPLNKDSYLMDFVLSNLEYCLKNNQIVLLPSNSLFLYESIDQTAFDAICHKERKTIRRNEHIEIKEADFSEDFFAFWKEYDLVRFNENQSQEFVDFFKTVYALKSFKLYAYYSNQRVVAYNVCYFSETQKVLYDVLFPWLPEKSIYRIGIFSVIENLAKALKMDWGYSICYGIFEYKTQLLKGLKDVKQ